MTPVLGSQVCFSVCKFTLYTYSIKQKSHFCETNYVQSLPAIQNLIINAPSHHHLIIAIILILKHAVFLRPLKISRSALSQAAQNYQESNIDSKIQQYLKACSPEDTVKQFAGFIMATDIVPPQSSIDTGESRIAGSSIAGSSTGCTAESTRSLGFWRKFQKSLKKRRKNW
ncbi:hypothetical protein EI94DRAFT_178700 [Lactarius quietus]|nr:hypothetical protein EI94DRAFT_178700 [Lactarius quietus]